jgi:hypothetical protein
VSIIQWESLLSELESGNSRAVSLFRELHNAIYLFEKVIIESIACDFYCLNALEKCKRAIDREEVAEILQSIRKYLVNLNSDGFSNIEIYSDSIQAQLNKIVANQTRMFLDVSILTESSTNRTNNAS